MAAHDALAVSARIAAALPIPPEMNFICIESIPHHRLIKATAVATDAASCADCRMSAQFRPPILGAISGTTIESLGLSAALSGLPENHSPLLFFAAITDPSARMTNTAFLSASCVNPPD